MDRAGEPVSHARTRVDPRVGCLIILAAIVVSLALLGRDNDRPSPRVVTTGDVVTLNRSTKAAVTEKSLEELQKSMDAQDETGITALFLGGLVTLLDQGTKVRVLDPASDGVFGDMAEVRVESGEHRGSKLYLSRWALKSE